MRARLATLLAATAATNVFLASCAGTGTASSTSSAESYLANAPTTCPEGIAQALGSALNESYAGLNLDHIQAVGEVSAADIGLGKIADKVACAVRADSSATGGTALVFMRAELSDDDVRRIAWNLDFGDETDGYMTRTSAARGEAVGFSRTTYGGLSRTLGGTNWETFRTAFPPSTVVLDVDLNIPHVLKKCKTNGPGPYPARAKSKPLPAPKPKVVSCRPWTWKEQAADFRKMVDDVVGGSGSSGGRWCEDVTSYDYDWQNDMLCHRPNGSSFYTDYEGADAYLGY
jgi:hypothetical protein